MAGGASRGEAHRWIRYLGSFPPKKLNGGKAIKTLQIILIGLIFGMGQGAMVAHAAEVKLTASDAAKDHWFGMSVSISGDYAIVGANGNDDAGSNSGSAYIFVRSAETWNEQAKLTASDAAWEDRFGSSVSINDTYAISLFIRHYLQLNIFLTDT